MHGTYRGRLIFPFVATLRQLDTETTQAMKPDGKGFDEDFKEPSPLAPVSGEGPGETPRQELAPLLLPCQVEMGVGEKVRQFFQGADFTGRMVLVFHFRDLERLGLVDGQGNATIRTSDRLESIADRFGVTVFTPRDPLFVVEVTSTAFGIGRRRNLLTVFFEVRDKAAGP